MARTKKSPQVLPAELDGLTPKQALFVAEYVKDFNGSRAALAAGYSPRAASSSAYENLKNPQIAAAIADTVARLVNRPLSEAERVIQEAIRLAYSDVRKVFDACGNLKPIADLDDETAPAIASVEVTTRSRRDGESEETKKFRFWDKTRGLDLLARYHKLLTDKVEHSGKVETVLKTEYDDLSTAEIRARLRAALEQLGDR